MHYTEIANYIEKNELFPKLNIKKYDRKNFGNFLTRLVYRYDTRINLTDDLFKNKIEWHSENDEVTDLHLLNPGFNYYVIDNDTIHLDKTLYNNINTNININFGIYYKNINKFKDAVLPTPTDLVLNINNLKNNYSLFKEEKFVQIKDNFIQFINLKNFDRIISSFDQINYITNKNKWISTRKEIGEVEYWIQKFSEEGFKYPLCFLLTDNNMLYPIACNCRVFAALYLNLPSIPACIVISNDKIDYKNKVI